MRKIIIMELINIESKKNDNEFLSTFMQTKKQNLVNK